MRATEPPAAAPEMRTATAAPPANFTKPGRDLPVQRGDHMASDAAVVAVPQQVVDQPEECERDHRPLDERGAATDRLGQRLDRADREHREGEAEAGRCGKSMAPVVLPLEERMTEDGSQRQRQRRSRARAGHDQEHDAHTVVHHAVAPAPAR